MQHNKRIITAKIESSYASDSGPSGTQAIQISDLSMMPLESSAEERNNIRPTFGANPAILTGKHTKVDFKVELAGSGTAGTVPAYDCLLQACALKLTKTSTKCSYKAVSNSTKSVSIYFNVDGTLHKLIGARGTFSLSMETSKIPYISFSFTGLFTQPSAQALPTPNYSAFTTPLVVGEGNTANFSLFGLAANALSFNMDLSNEVVNHQTINSQRIIITDRKSKANITFEAPSLSTKNYWALATESVLGELSFTHGTVAGNIISFNAPKVQLLSPSYGESNGIVTIETELSITPTVGDDEFTLEIK